MGALKDLCKTCVHYWQDFPLPLDRTISHCEILDSKHGLASETMDDRVPYPCTVCPFDSYSGKYGRIDGGCE